MYVVVVDVVVVSLFGRLEHDCGERECAGEEEEEEEAATGY